MCRSPCWSCVPVSGRPAGAPSRPLEAVCGVRAGGPDRYGTSFDTGAGRGRRAARRLSLARAAESGATARSVEFRNAPETPPDSTHLCLERCAPIPGDRAAGVGPGARALRARACRQRSNERLACPYARSARGRQCRSRCAAGAGCLAASAPRARCPRGRGSHRIAATTRHHGESAGRRCRRRFHRAADHLFRAAVVGPGGRACAHRGSCHRGAPRNRAPRPAAPAPRPPHLLT